MDRRERTADESEKPNWWRQNETLRAEMDLPPYEPSTFADGVYTYTVISAIESEFDCTVRFVGVNPRYPDDWEVRINNRTAFDIGRHRNENGNTVYEMTAEAFERKIRACIKQ